MKELTSEILGIEVCCKYYITENGEIFNSRINRFMKQEITKFGYKRIEIKRKHFLVHRLVALAFIPNPKNKPVVNHKNRDVGDNRVENLEWCTIKENVNYAPTKQLRDENIKRGQECNFHKLTEEQVVAIIDMINGCVFSNSDIATLFNVSAKTIRNIKNKKTWRHLSYLLK